MEIRWLGRIPYAEGLEIQHRTVESISGGEGEDTLFLLEHEEVYTIGRTRDQSSLRDPASLSAPIFETNRGGQATWHGPGQLVAYPILDLQQHGKDLHRYLRFLEEVTLLTCTACGVRAGRRESLTGVWVEDRKIASVGVGVRRWVSMHGLALNVSHACLAAFTQITPCGIDGVQMTSLETESGISRSVEEVGQVLAEIFLRELPTLKAPP